MHQQGQARRAPSLREGGLVLACIPNVQHMSVLVGLMRGQFRYQDEGLLDRTHLRFFTLEGVRELFAGAGLALYDVQPRISAGPSHEKLRELLAPALAAIGVDAAQFARQTAAIQYVARGLSGAPPPRRLSIQTLIHEPGLSDRARHYPRQLSGGQEQRVGIARAIVTDPTLLLCDEPTGDLDRKSGDEVLELLTSLNRDHGKTIIMVTHDPHAAERARRTLHLEKGLLLETAA